MLSLIISTTICIFFVALTVYYWRHQLEMSEIGRKHFRTGLLFAVISSTIFTVLCVAVFIEGDRAPFTPVHPLNFWIVFAGFVTNGISMFSFLRELIQLLPGGDFDDITPEGMTLGFLMGLAQLVWLILGFGLMFAP